MNDAAEPPSAEVQEDADLGASQTAGAVEAGAVPVFDPAVIRKTIGDDPSVIRDIVGVVLRDMEEQTQGLKRAFEEQDLPKVSRYAHASKASPWSWAAKSSATSH